MIDTRNLKVLDEILYAGKWYTVDGVRPSVARWGRNAAYLRCKDLWLDPIKIKDIRYYEEEN